MAQAKKSMKKTAGKKPATKKVTVKPKAATGNGDPKEVVKKAFLVGLGATVMTAEKVKASVTELVNDMVDKGHLPKKDATRLISDLQKRADSEKGNVQKKVKGAVDSAVKKTISSLGLVTRDELEKALGKPGPGPVKKSKKSTKSKPIKKKPAAKKPAAKKSTAKKPAAKKVTAAKKKPAATRARAKKPGK